MKKRMLCMLLVLTMVFTMVPLAAFAEDYPSMSLDECYFIELTPDMSVWYQFTPEETRKYEVYSFDEDSVDPCCNVYDSEMNLIAAGDDYNGSNFSQAIELTAGATYYFEFFEYDTNDEGSYSVTLTYAMPTDIFLDEYSIASYTGYSFVLGVGMYPYEVPATWASSDNSVATVDENGLVNCVGVGEAKITVSVGELSDTCWLTVKDGGVPIYVDDVKTVTFVPKEKRETAQTFCFVPEESGTYRMYSYDIVTTTPDSPVDPRIWVRDAFVNEVGYDDDDGEDVNSDVQCRLEAGKPYYFEVEPYDCEAAGQITVTLVKCVSAESMTIDCGDLTLEEGEVADIYVTFSPENCAQEDYTCESSDTSVVRIEEKTAVCVGGGEATITVTSEYGLIDTINITVTSIEEIFVDTNYTLECSVSSYGGSHKYRFTPTESGVYRFESFNTTGGWNPRVSLGNRYEPLRYGDDVGEDLNFSLEYDLVAGEDYFITVEGVEVDGSEEDGSIDFKVSKLDDSAFTEVESGSSTDVNVEVAGNAKYFIFKPASSGTYSIFSSAKDGEYSDTKMEIFDSEWEMVGKDDDSAGESQYSCEIKLFSGRTYYIKSFLYINDEIGTHVMNIEFLGGAKVDSETVEDTAIEDDEVATLETVFRVSDYDYFTDSALFLVNGSEYVEYNDLTENDNHLVVSYDFSSDDFADGILIKKFVFGVFVDEEWRYGNEFTVSYVCDCSIAFDANGGVGTVNGATATSGEEYVLPENSFTAPAGMRFKAWLVNGEEKAVGDVIVILSKEITVTAVWEDIIGDIDGNYEAEVTDYILLKRSCLDTYELSEAKARRADINKDGSVNVVDYMLLKRVCLGTYTIE